MPSTRMGLSKCTFLVHMVLMFSIGVVVAFASASATDTSDAHCSIDGECSVKGAVLLQRKGSSSSGTSGADEEEEDAAEEQLIQYTKLKQALSQSQESAHIMESIDQVLDQHDNAHSIKKEGSHKNPIANAAHKLDDIFDAERAHSLGEMLKKDSETSGGSAASSGSQKQGLSLLAVDSQEHARSPKGVHTTKLTGIGMTAQEKSDAADAADAKAIQDAMAQREKNDSENEVQDNDEAAEVENDSQDDAEAEDDEAIGRITKAVEQSEEQDDGEAEDAQDDGEAEDDEAIGKISKNMGQKVSMIAQGTSVASSAKLSEKGYLDVARLRSNEEMKIFVKRFIDDLSLKVTDPGGLAGVVPYYSGRKAVQSFAALRIELLSAARNRDGWLVRDKQKPLLLQTEVTQSRHRHHHHHHHQHEREPEQASFLQVVHLQMVPDLMVALFGNVTRAVLLFCTAILFLCMLGRDERKALKGEYEDPWALDVSPAMPSIKEEMENEAEEQDVTVVPTPKVVRGGRQSVPKPGK